MQLFTLPNLRLAVCAKLSVTVVSVHALCIRSRRGVMDGLSMYSVCKCEVAQMCWEKGTPLLWPLLHGCVSSSSPLAAAVSVHCFSASRAVKMFFFFCKAFI